MSIRFPKSCRTREERSARASLAATTRWTRLHAANAAEPVRRQRDVVTLTILRHGLDARPTEIRIVDDGGHRRRQVIENGTAWTGLYGRKALTRWINQILRSAGV